jgi:hypothetical protein
MRTPGDWFLPRRAFLKGVLAGAGAVSVGGPQLLAEPLSRPDPSKTPYPGPKVIIVRFGGGARRRETIDPQTTFAPFLCHEFANRGTLFSRMEIDSFAPTVGVDTSHGQGTLYIITGKYEKYKDITEKFLFVRGTRSSDSRHRAGTAGIGRLLALDRVPTGRSNATTSQPILNFLVSMVREAVPPLNSSPEAAHDTFDAPLDFGCEIQITRAHLSAARKVAADEDRSRRNNMRFGQLFCVK